MRYWKSVKNPLARSWAFTLAFGPLVLVGCQSSEPAPREAEPAPAKESATVRPPLKSSKVRIEPNAEKTHRAREFYLRGLKCLVDDPPRIEAAINEFQLALRQDPLFYRAHFKLGYAYYHQGQYSLEMAEYKKCLAIRPDYQPALLNLAHAYLAQDRLEEARKTYLKVLDQDPKHAIARYNLGLIQFDLQEYESSSEHLAKFLETQEGNQGVRGALVQQAKQCLERIRQRERESQKGTE